MRTLLLTSTAAICLVLAGHVANAQSDQKKDELKKEQVQQHQQQSQQQQNRRSTTGQAAEEKKTEPNRDTGSSSEKKDQNAATKPSAETNKNARTDKSKRDEGKSASEQKQNASPSKSTASEQNKASESTKPATAEAPKSATQRKQESASTPSSKPNATNTETNKSSASTANQAQPNAKTSAAQADPQKKVQISETISKTRNLAPPVRNLNISITVGQRVPRRVHLRPLPRTIVTIAPEYRGYDYFTTEEDVIIVSPRTHEIVTRIPRDVSRARAEVSGVSSTAMSGNTSGGSAMPCQVMRRTASGETRPIDPAQLRHTTGSGGSSDRLAVRVQAPNGQQMPEVTLPDRQGRIVAETDGSGCRIIIEPGQVGR